MKNKLSKDSLIVYIFFATLSFLKGIGLSSSSKVYLGLYLVIVLLIAARFFRSTYKRRELFIIFSILACGFLDLVLGKETTILFSALGLLVLKNEKIDDIIKVMFWSRLIAFGLMIILPALNIIPMNTMIFYRDNSFITRYCFGYNHPNLVHSTFGLVVLLFIYSYFEKVNAKEVFLVEIINYVLYKFTFSRTGFLMITLFLVVFLLTKKNKKFESKLPKTLNITLFLIIAVSFSLALMYGKYGFVDSINEALTGRIRYMHIMFTKYHIPLFKTKDYTNINFDNGFCDLLFNGGLIVFFILLKLQVKTNKYFVKNKMTKEAMLTLFMFIYSFTESYYMSFLMNPSLLLLSYVIFNSNKENKNEER